MARKATGEIRKTSEGYTARIRVGDQRVTFALPTCRDDSEAEARAALLAGLATRFRRAGVLDTPDAKKVLGWAAGAKPDPPSGAPYERGTFYLSGVLKVAGEVVGGELVDIEPGGAPLTFKAFAEQWIDGRLHREYPDQVDDIDQTQNSLRLEKYVYPVLGAQPLATIKREDCDGVMRKIPGQSKDNPKGLGRSSRRHVAQVINRILNLAELAGHIERNPIPRGWLPKPSAQKRFPVLYPAEDRALLGCTKIPLARRIFYGYMHREGGRRGEGADLRIPELDLDNGTVSLDENKTDHARFWRLGDGVAKALSIWIKTRGDIEPDARVFTDEHGRPLQLRRLADQVRDDLRLAGITRADLFSEGPNKGRFGIHCFRRSYVTRTLALGRTEDHVRQRTGHTSDELLRYRQAAKALAELDLGEVDPLDQAIPEIRALAMTPPGGVDTRPSKEQSRGNQNPAIAPRSPREGGGTGRRAGFRFQS